VVPPGAGPPAGGGEVTSSRTAMSLTAPRQPDSSDGV
jgi:hypothetical protein